MIQRTSSGGGIQSPEVTSYQYDSAGRLAAKKVQAGTQAELTTQR